MISILLISRYAAPLIRLRRTFPHPGDRINRSMLSCRDMAPWLITHSAPSKRGKGGGASHQRGMHFRRPQGGCMVFQRAKPGCPVLAATGGIKNGARKGAVPRQRSDTIYLPRAEHSTRPGGVSRSRTEPLAPRAKGPAAPSTLARRASTYGNTGKHRADPGPDPDRAEGALHNPQRHSRCQT